MQMRLFKFLISLHLILYKSIFLNSIGLNKIAQSIFRTSINTLIIIFLDEIKLFVFAFDHFIEAIRQLYYIMS